MLAQWLKAKYYVSSYKPVPIEEYLVYEHAVYTAATTHSFYNTATQLNSKAQLSSQAKPIPCHTIQPSDSKELANPVTNAVVALACETARAGYGALVFCSSRTGCESDASLISRVMPGPDEVGREIMSRRTDLLHDLRNTTTGLDPMLEMTVPCGVAFHRRYFATLFDEGYDANEYRCRTND